jgi:hypothetical protein
VAPLVALPGAQPFGCRFGFVEELADHARARAVVAFDAVFRCAERVCGGDFVEDSFRLRSWPGFAGRSAPAAPPMAVSALRAGPLADDSGRCPTLAPPRWFGHRLHARRVVCLPCRSQRRRVRLHRLKPGGCSGLRLAMILRAFPGLRRNLAHHEVGGALARSASGG